MLFEQYKIRRKYKYSNKYNILLREYNLLLKHPPREELTINNELDFYYERLLELEELLKNKIIKIEWKKQI